MAAGMGSRYGGLKQLDGVGPSGETIMDYSVFDAARAGFGKVVFVIGRHFERDFREKVLAKYEGRIPTETVGYGTRRTDGRRNGTRTVRRDKRRRLLRPQWL